MLKKKGKEKNNKKTDFSQFTFIIVIDKLRKSLEDAIIKLYSPVEIHDGDFTSAN